MLTRDKPNIIVVGGSFNPPTLAHYKITEMAIESVQAAKVYLVPVSYAYLKRKMVKVGEGNLCLSDEKRLEMLRTMWPDGSRIVIYTEEMKQTFAITYLTMDRIQELHPEANILFLIGADKLALIERFAQTSDFLDRFGVLVFARNGEDPLEEIRRSERLAEYADSFIIARQPDGIDGISSTAIRKHLFDIDSVSEMLHPNVVPILKTLSRQDFPEEIISFKDEYAFLDNLYPADVIFEGLVYPSVESAFQASKLENNTERKRFVSYGRDKVKAIGSRITPYKGWEDKKLTIMETLLKEKFLQHPELRGKLLETGERKLIAGNKKGETFWGTDLTTWEGQNRLGEILMNIKVLPLSRTILI